jgi:hypothetical protein
MDLSSDRTRSAVDEHRHPIDDEETSARHLVDGDRGRQRDADWPTELRRERCPKKEKPGE